MQVKKFEARSMKEALIMVKTQLGPEAIILSAKDNSRRFGLVGEHSVEVTAAIPENLLRKKEFVESRIPKKSMNAFQNASVKNQRQIIDQTVKAYEQRSQVRSEPVRYIDLQDEEQQQQIQNSNAVQLQSQMRVKNAAQQAAQAFEKLEPSSKSFQVQATFDKNSNTVTEVETLKKEILELRQLLGNFQTIPQTIIAGHPGADVGLRFEVSHAFKKLVQAGVSPEIAAHICDKSQKTIEPMRLKNPSLVEAWIARYLLETTKTCDAKKDRKIQLYFGPYGSGKTSTLIKAAGHAFINEKKRIAFATTDNVKLGAVQQLKIFAQILNVPFYSIQSPNDWSVLAQHLNKYDFVYVDFPGTSLRSIEEISRLKSLFPQEMMDLQRHLVLSALSKDQDCQEAGKKFKTFRYDDVIFTNLDESAAHGNIYNFMSRFDCPLHSFGVGSKIPEDYERATKERMLDLLFKISSKRLGEKTA